MYGSRACSVGRCSKMQNHSVRALYSYVLFNARGRWRLLSSIELKPLLTYLLLLETLTGLQLAKKFTAFHGTRRFITALTSVRHLSLSWASPIQSIYPHPTSWRPILISTHLRLGLPSGLLPSGFPTKTLYTELKPWSFKFDFHMAVHLNIILIEKPTKCTNIYKIYFILECQSTCFGWSAVCLLAGTR